MPGKHTGRTSALEKTPAIGKKLIELVGKGVSQTHAIKLVGIPESIFYAWMIKGEKPGAKECYRKFAEGIKEAHTKFIERHLDNISLQGARQWQASAWMLERCVGDNKGSHSCPRHPG